MTSLNASPKLDSQDWKKKDIENAITTVKSEVTSLSVDVSDWIEKSIDDADGNFDANAAVTILNYVNTKFFVWKEFSDAVVAMKDGRWGTIWLTCVQLVTSQLAKNGDITPLNADLSPFTWGDMEIDADFGSITKAYTRGLQQKLWISIDGVAWTDTMTALIAQAGSLNLDPGSVAATPGAPWKWWAAPTKPGASPTLSIKPRAWWTWGILGLNSSEVTTIAAQVSTLSSGQEYIWLLPSTDILYAKIAIPWKPNEGYSHTKVLDAASVNNKYWAWWNVDTDYYWDRVVNRIVEIIKVDGNMIYIKSESLTGTMDDDILVVANWVLYQKVDPIDPTSQEFRVSTKFELDGDRIKSIEKSKVWLRDHVDDLAIQTVLETQMASHKMDDMVDGQTIMLMVDDNIYTIQATTKVLPPSNKRHKVTNKSEYIRSYDKSDLGYDTSTGIKSVTFTWDEITMDIEKKPWSAAVSETITIDYEDKVYKVLSQTVWTTTLKQYVLSPAIKKVNTPGKAHEYALQYDAALDTGPAMPSYTARAWFDLWRANLTTTELSQILVWATDVSIGNEKFVLSADSPRILWVLWSKIGSQKYPNDLKLMYSDIYDNWELHSKYDNWDNCACNDQWPWIQLLDDTTSFSGNILKLTVWDGIKLDATWKPEKDPLWNNVPTATKGYEIVVTKAGLIFEKNSTTWVLTPSTVFKIGASDVLELIKKPVSLTLRNWLPDAATETKFETMMADYGLDASNVAAIPVWLVIDDHIYTTTPTKTKQTNGKRHIITDVSGKILDKAWVSKGKLWFDKAAAWADGILSLTPSATDNSLTLEIKEAGSTAKKNMTILIDENGLVYEKKVFTSPSGPKDMYIKRNDLQVKQVTWRGTQDRYLTYTN